MINENVQERMTTPKTEMIVQSPEFAGPTSTIVVSSTRLFGQASSNWRRRMRQLKFHEKKLLKKVDFLNVQPLPLLVLLMKTF